MIKRIWKAMFGEKPEVGDIFEHRDIDLCLEIIEVGKKVVVKYGYLTELGAFKQLPKRHLRATSNYDLHYNYYKITC
jgi:hypothetical protein